MPVIPNYISRFRTHSQSTAATGSSVNTTSESQSASTLEPPLTEASTANTSALQPIKELEAKTNPDLDAHSAEPDANVPLLHSMDESVTLQDKVEAAAQLVTEEHPVEVLSQSSQLDHESIPLPSNSPSNSPGPSFLSKILGTRSTQSEANVSGDSHNPQVTLPNWATFGRKGVPVMTRINEFGSLYRRGRNEGSSKSSSSRQQVTPPSSTPTPYPPSQPSASPAGTVSSSSGSRAYSQQSHSVRSRRQPLSHPDTIPDAEGDSHQSPSRAAVADLSFMPHTAQLSQSSAVASNTFGRGTKRPAAMDDDEKADYDGSNAVAELFAPTRTSTPPPPERLVRYKPPWTYPPPSRRRSLPKGGSVSFPSLRKKKSRRSVDDVFGGRDGTRRMAADLFAAAAFTAQATALPAAAQYGNKLEKGKDDAKVESVNSEESKKDLAGKNPTLFGSVGRDRHAFLRAGRGKSIPTSTRMSPGNSSVSSPGETPSTMSTGVGSVGGTTLGSTAVFPSRVLRSRPQSATAGPARADNISDPEHALSGSAFDIMDMAASSAKRKMLDSQEDVTMQASSSGATKGILLNPKRESSRPSDASHAPSSFRQPKRIRLSTPGASSSSSPPTHTRALSPNHAHLSPPNSPTAKERPPSSLRSFSSQASSIPVRAIVSPKPPSIVSRNSMYHMRDPVLPPSRRESAQWSGAARTKIELGESSGQAERMFPLQAWAFVIGFVLFPVWWVAAVMPIKWGWTRRRGVQDGKGKGEWDGDDMARETLEYDVAYTWRQRCRIMGALGLFVYIPLIVLVAVFVPRAEA